MAPVAPDAGLPGAVDAHWVAPNLDKIHGSRFEAGQPARSLVPNIVQHLREDLFLENDGRGCRKKTMHFKQCLASKQLSLIILRVRELNQRNYRKLTQFSKELH